MQSNTQHIVHTQNQTNKLQKTQHTSLLLNHSSWECAAKGWWKITHHIEQWPINHKHSTNTIIIEYEKGDQPDGWLNIFLCNCVADELQRIIYTFKYIYANTLWLHNLVSKNISFLNIMFIYLKKKYIYSPIQNTRIWSSDTKFSHCKR